MKPSIIIVDDHKLVSKAIAELIEGFSTYEILFDLNNGKELLEKLKNKKNIPDIVLLDINTPIMNGFETMKILNAEYPQIKVLALSMNDDEETIIKIIKLGACGYISKLIDDEELKLALDTIIEKGFYYTEGVTNFLVHSLKSDINKPEKIKFSDREKEMLKLICTELTYKEIADKMFLSPKTIDGYRDALFHKIGVKTRVGLAIYAIKNNYYKI